MVFRRLLFGYLFFVTLSLYYIKPVLAECIETENSQGCGVISTSMGCTCSPSFKLYCTNYENGDATWCSPEQIPIHTQRWECDNGDDPPCGASCFLPGTKISTSNGEKNIESLKAGDKVLSFDEKTGQTVENTVADSIVSERNEYYVIKTSDGREVKTTAEHPFYTGVRGEDTGQGGEAGKPLTKMERIIDFIKNIPLYFKVGWQGMFNQ